MVEPNRDITKRMNYFDRQFLRAQDFADERDYIVDRLTRHQKLQHTSGISEGLEVTASLDVGKEKAIFISPGTAHDASGHDIIVLISREESLPELAEFRDTATQQYLSPVFVTIAYHDELSDLSADPGNEQQFTRILEKPELIFSITSPNNRNQLLLASVNRDPDSGNITTVDTNPPGRQRPGGFPPSSIATDALTDGAVTELKIADGSVSESKLLDANVTNSKLSEASVTTDKIANETIQLTNLNSDIQNLLRQIPRMSSGVELMNLNDTILITHGLGSVPVAIILGIRKLDVNPDISIYGNVIQANPDNLALETASAAVNNAAPDGTFALSSFFTQTVSVQWLAIALPG